MSTGCNVVDVGMIPTPCLYFASLELNIPSAIMLTGSHNPPDYWFDHHQWHGNLWCSWQDIYAMIMTQDFLHGSGTYSVTDCVPKYIQIVRQKLSLHKPLRIVVDAGNGVTGAIVPTIYRQLGCEIIPLYCEVDGHFLIIIQINESC